jgi:quercetin dioxygenase-like cupin family protein
MRVVTPTSLDVLADEQLEQAARAASGRSTATVHGGGGQRLRQVLLALRAGACLPEHENPGEATLLVLRGAVRLRAADRSWEGRAGDLLVVPGERHAVEAHEDAAVLLTLLARD